MQKTLDYSFDSQGMCSAEAPDSQKILDFVGVRLSAAPEESDVPLRRIRKS